MAVICATSLYDLTNVANNQFSQDNGLHLNSSAWEGRISVGPTKYYSFMVNGDLKFTTRTSTNGKKYDQILKICDYKKFESAILLLFLANIDIATISDFITNCYKLSNVRITCNCASLQYYGGKYNLTQMKAQYGLGEMRPPNIKDPGRENIVCKHLWTILNTLDNDMANFIKNLIPYYKRYFGITSPTGIERTCKTMGENGIRKLIATAQKELLRLNNRDIVNIYNDLVKDSLNTIFQDTVELEQG